MYLFTVIIRLLWSLSIGLAFFAIGLVFFLLFDILAPKSTRGYKILNYMYKHGSLGSFKGLRVEQDEYDIDVEKRRQGEHQF